MTPPQVTISVDVLDALAKAKLVDLGIQADKLNAKKIVIQSDAQTGTATRQVAQLADAEGNVVTMNTRWTKTGKEVTTVTQQWSDSLNRSQRSLIGVMALSQAVYAAFYAIVGALRTALTEMKNVDTQLVDVRKVTDASVQELEAFKQRAYEVGKAYGIVASDYLSAVAAMSRAGYREQAGDLAELSAKLQLVGNVSEEVANQLLISVDKAYDLQGSYEKLSVVIDQLNEVDNKFATSIEKVAEGMGIIAPVASQAHMTIEELVAAVGTITATTQRSGSEAARALRSLVLNIIGDTKTEIEDGVTWTVDEINDLHDVLKKYSPEAVRAAQATGEVIDPMKAIGGLAQSMKDGLLTEQELFAMVSKLGGKLRSSQLMALIQNWDMYNDMLDKTANALGSADKEVENALDSWQVKLNQLKNTFTQFISDSLSTDFIKGLLDSASSVLEGIGNIGNALLILGGIIVTLKLPSIIAVISKIGSSIFLLTGKIVSCIAATSSGVSVTQAISTAFGGMAVSASLAQIAVGALTAVIAIGIIAYNKYNQKLNETIERGKKAYDELKSIDELEVKYKKLYKQYEEGSISQEEYVKGKDEVIAKLDEEGVWVDEVTGKYKNLEDKIKGAIDKAKEYKLIEIEDAIDALVEKSYGKGGLISTKYAADYLGVSKSGNRGTLPFWDLETMVAMYDMATDRRVELRGEGKRNSPEDIVLKRYIESVEELVTEYKELNEARDEYLGVNSKDDTVKSETDETAESVKRLSDELKTATNALDKYKKALEGGEKGDALKSYSEAYKKAVEMYEKGLTGSKQYMSAIDLLFGNVDDYEAAGKLLGNAFVKAMFEGGGDDYGTNAANYIRKHLDEFEGVAITEGENGTFGLNVTDMEAFAKSTGLTTDALWTLIDALDIFDSKTTYTKDQLYDLIGLEDGGRKKFVNLTDLINDLAGQGKSAREIKGIVDALKELAKTDDKVSLISTPEDIDQTISDIVGLYERAEEYGNVEVTFESNSEEFFDDIYAQIDRLNGSTIYIGLKIADLIGIDDLKDNSHQVRGRYTYASGTKSARGGLSLVNEEGAEIIYANGKAWIAGGGDPTITNLPAGAGVFTAKETREILTRSGIESHDGEGAYVGGIPEFTSGGSGKAGKGKLTESLLKQIADYINDILKKAKEALQEQLDAIDEQIDKLKREHDAEEDANKLEELRLKILEAEKKLAEAENERTVRYFNKETGQWEWMADQKAVADAQKALQEAQEAYDKEVAEQAYQAQLQALEDQKDSLNEAYNQLSDNWDKIYEELEDILNGESAVDIAKLIQQLLGTKGGSYAPDIQALLEAIGAFTANPTSVLDAETTARIMSMNGTTGGATSVLSAMLGSGSYDLNGRAQSTLGGNTSIVGDTIYYINGVQIGSDMMNKPLSQILSVLPIYANAN